ncbi:unnamed protein product [Musa acuminata var. zebrina]
MRWEIFPSSPAVMAACSVTRSQMQTTGVAVQIPVADEGACVEPRQTHRWPQPVAKQHGDGAGEAVVGDVEGGETGEEAELVGAGTGKEVGMEVDDVEVGAEGELRGDGPGEVVGGEVEDGEVEEGGELRRDGAFELVGGEVEGLEVGAVGDEGGDGAAEGEACEGQLVDAPVVAGDALEVGGEAVAGGGEVGSRPVPEAAVGVRQAPPQVRQARLVAGFRHRRRRKEED